MDANRDVRDMKDALDSLHQRMDRFYAWASQLQVEMRNAHQRLGFLEATAAQELVFHGSKEADIDAASEESILARLNSLHHK